MGKDLKGNSIGKGFSQRKDGVYIARLRIEGKKSPVCLYSTDLEVLRKDYQKTKEEYESGKIKDVTNMTVDEWFHRWISLYHIDLKNTSMTNYYTNYNRISEYVGHQKLVKIRQSNIQKAINCLNDEGYSYSTIVSTKNILFAMFNKAIECELIFRNPCVGVVLPSKQNVKVVPLSSEMEQKFFKAINGQRYENLFRILLYTGMRIGEAVALEWEDVDFDKKTIKIYKTLNRTKQYNRKGEKINGARLQITSTKKNASERTIPLLDNASVEFLKWKKKQDADKMKRSDWGKTNYLSDKYPNLIFTTATGKPLAPGEAWLYCNQGVNRVNEEEVMLAELEHRKPELLVLHPHIFRHTYATRCIEKGMNPKAVQKLLGHASLEMLETYTHPSLEFLRDECEKCLVEAPAERTSEKIVYFPSLKKSV